MQNSYDKEITYAGFWVRLAAYLIDSIIVFLGLLVIRGILAGVTAVTGMGWMSDNLLFHYSFKEILLYLCQVLYFILLTYCTGTTLGKRAMNLRVVRAGDLQPAGLFDIVYRETIGRFLSGLICCAGYLMIGIDKEKQALHDRLCDTRVIYSKKIRVVEFKTIQPVPGPYAVLPPQNGGNMTQMHSESGSDAVKTEAEE